MFTSLEDSTHHQCLIAEQAFDLTTGIATSPTTCGPGKDDSFAVFLGYGQPRQGGMLLECSHSLAFEFTHRFMDVPLPVSFTEDVKDAMSELANIIGGNLKRLLDPDTKLAMPAFLQPGSSPAASDSGVVMSRLCFDTQYGGYSLSLLQL